MAIEFEIHEFFARPPDIVFGALTDLDGASAWMPGFVGIDRLTDGPFQVGTEWRETRRMFGRETTEQFEVTTSDAPSRIGIRVDGTKGSSKRGEYLFDYRLQPDQGGTRVYLSGSIHQTGLLGTLLGLLLVLPYKRMCANDLRALKHHLEKDAR